MQLESKKIVTNSYVIRIFYMIETNGYFSLRWRGDLSQQKYGCIEECRE